MLAERARRLAAPAGRTGAELVPALALDVGPERYALPLEGVLRVERRGGVARLPGGAARLVAVDGRPCALIEVSALLGAAASHPAPERRWVVVLGRSGPELALPADAVDLVPIPASLLAARGAGPRLGATEDARLVLDGAALLDPPSGGGA